MSLDAPGAHEREPYLSDSGSCDGSGFGNEQGCVGVSPSISEGTEQDRQGVDCRTEHVGGRGSSGEDGSSAENQKRHSLA